MNSIAVIVLLFCLSLFCWAFYRQFVAVAEQLKLVRMIEKTLLLIWDDPKHLLIFEKVDQANEASAKAVLELIEKSEAHQKNKSQLSEKKKAISVMQREHQAIEKFVGDLIASGLTCKSRQ